MADPIKNFSKCSVSTGYNSSATTVVLSGGEGAKLPQPSTDGAFNLIWFNSHDYGDPTDDPYVEIVRCTARSTDTLTITRAQEGTTAHNHNASDKNWQMILGLTKKTMDDIATEFSTDEALLPSSGQKNALVGSSGTPGSGNKYLTEDDKTNNIEVLANKDTTTTLGTSDTKYPSQKAVKTYVDKKTAMLYTIASVTPANNTNENSVFSTTISANSLSATGLLKVEIPIYLGAPDTGTTYTIRLKFGGSAVATGTIEFPSIGGGSGSATYGLLTAYIINNGATNSQNVFIGFTVGGTMGATTIQAYVGSIQTTTSSVDTTSIQTLEITQQKSASHGSIAYQLGTVILIN
jgi:hypothetical protein